MLVRLLVGHPEWTPGQPIPISNSKIDTRYLNPGDKIAKIRELGNMNWSWMMWSISDFLGEPPKKTLKHFVWSSEKSQGLPPLTSQIFWALFSSKIDVFLQFQESMDAI